MNVAFRTDGLPRQSALVLAGAGLDRLNRAEWVHQRFDPTEMCPAPGQGALALEILAADTERAHYLRQSLAFFNHPQTRFSARWWLPMVKP